MHNLGFKIVKGGGGGGKHVKELMEQHPMFALYLLGTEMSSVDEAWFGKRKEQTLYGY